MKEKRKVLYIAQEIAPYVPDSSISVRGRLVPQGMMEDKAFEVRTFTPRYAVINERRNQLHEVIRLSGMNIIIDDTDHPLIIKVATLLPTRMQVYFIENEDYFRHSPVKELETVVSPAENDERLMFFARGVVETVKKLRWAPEAIICSGWLSSLVPMYLKRLYQDDPTLAGAKIIYCITDPATMVQPLSADLIRKLKTADLTDRDLAPILKRHDISAGVDLASLTDLAVHYADAVVVDTDPLPDTLDAIVAAATKTKKAAYVADHAEAAKAMIALLDSFKA